MLQYCTKCWAETFNQMCFWAPRARCSLIVTTNQAKPRGRGWARRVNRLCWRVKSVVKVGARPVARAFWSLREHFEVIFDYFLSFRPPKVRRPKIKSSPRGNKTTKRYHTSRHLPTEESGVGCIRRGCRCARGEWTAGARASPVYGWMRCHIARS